MNLRSDAEDRTKCSDSARALSLSPAGSAPQTDGFLLVQWPLPWPRDVADVDELASVRTMISGLAGESIRLQLIAPVRGVERSRERAVILYRRAARHPGYVRSEATCAEHALTGVVEHLIDRAAQPTAAQPAIRDVLICTHGSRDACCGTYGTRLFTAASAEEWPAETRVWRTSHLGGHRFAPTLLTLPEGQCWGNVTLQSLKAIVDRSPMDIAAHYRGNTSIPTRTVQVVESAAFAARGWQWLQYSTSATFFDDGSGTTEVYLGFVDPEGGAGAFRATVHCGDPVVTPACLAQAKETVDHPIVIDRVTLLT